MLKHIHQLEKRSNKDRTTYVREVLVNMGIKFSIQPFRFRLLKGENIIVDHFCQSHDKNLLLLTAHTNKYFSSPGANDNASGVAVLLGIIELLLERKDGKKLGIKIVFFDHEDGLAYLDGSSYFVDHTDLSGVNFVLNLDGVGMGNSFTISPKITNETMNTQIQYLFDLFRKLKVKFYSFNLPPLLVEDHMPFVKKSISAISLNLMSESDLNFLMAMEKKSFIVKLANMLFYRGPFRKNHPMAIMRHRHNELDTSKYIEPLSLELCRKIVMELIEFHRRLLSI
ncbi:MAG: M28 family peptidase [Candidatus Roizmanbacteria bacterium]|nr:M28 family peptidase [Candidatus Roizmanbacteria bacterium]